MRKNLLIIIPARAGSKRVKNKNLKKINEKNDTLLGLKIKSCLRARIGDVLVSTDSIKIAKYAKKNGAIVPFLRSKIYASDKASTFSVILDTLRKLKERNKIIPDYIAVLPPTNPFLSYKSIINAFKCLKKNKLFNSILTYQASNDHPFNFIKLKKNKKISFDLFKYEGKKYSQFERTQDWPNAFMSSAAIKISKKSFFLKKIKEKSPLIQDKTFDMNSCLGYLISKKEAFDINFPDDFKEFKR